MKRILSIISAIAVTLTAAATDTSKLPKGAVTDIEVQHAESSLIVKMKIHPDVFSKASNRETWLTPVIVGAADTLRIDSVVVAGRTRYFQHLRGISDKGDFKILRAGSDKAFDYTAIIPYQNWMEMSGITIAGRVSGCAGCGIANISMESPVYKIDYRDKSLNNVDFVYVTPTKEIVKTRNDSGSAYIDFYVNETKIRPDYRNNEEELQKIISTIEDIRKDTDAKITSISFKGYASPEGSFSNNDRLAKERTEALIEYVRNLYAFPKDAMHASWEAEDWVGLEKKLEKMEIADKDALLAVVRDSKLSPDQKDNALKERFPEQYEILKTNVYPSLRHSDYNVEYQVRNFTDIAKIAELLYSTPQKLSLDEMFVYAQSLDKDSPEFREVMEIAVRMFPKDPEANLNAATTATSFGDFGKARKYLKKAGDTPVAIYTLGVIEAKEGNYDKAKDLLKQAADAGVQEASDVLDLLKSFGLIN